MSTSHEKKQALSRGTVAGLGIAGAVGLAGAAMSPIVDFGAAMEKAGPWGTAFIFLAGVILLWRDLSDSRREGAAALEALRREYEAKIEAKDAKVFELLDKSNKVLNVLERLASEPERRQ